MENTEKTCTKCGKSLPVTMFWKANRSSKPPRNHLRKWPQRPPPRIVTADGRSGRCIPCRKAQPSRLPGARQAQRRRANKSYRTAEEIENARWETWFAKLDAWDAREQAKLDRAAAPKVPKVSSAEAYRNRYRNDPAFRQREIARTWARKAASGVLRTDGRTERRVSEDGTLTAAVVRQLFRDAKECAYCFKGLGEREKTMDHKTPVSKGGLHSIHNVCICCRSCNSRKGTTDYAVWLAKRAA